jgi:hypothetical protein
MNEKKPQTPWQGIAGSLMVLGMIVGGTVISMQNERKTREAAEQARQQEQSRQAAEEKALQEKLNEQIAQRAADDERIRQKVQQQLEEELLAENKFKPQLKQPLISDSGMYVWSEPEGPQVPDYGPNPKPGEGAKRALYKRDIETINRLIFKHEKSKHDVTILLTLTGKYKLRLIPYLSPTSK